MSLVLAGCGLVFGGTVHAWQWEQTNGFRNTSLPVPRSGQSGFTRLSTDVTGITFTNVLPQERSITNQILLNGSGVAAGDIDGDGWCDLYFCAIAGSNALYRNLGNWKFADVTESAGVALPGLAATGAVFADLDGDGDLDLIVNSVGGGTHLFFNDSKGHFSRGPVLNGGKGGMSIAVADIDGDGFLDFYLTNYRTSGLMDMPNAHATFKVVNGKVALDRIDGRSMTEPDLAERFYINEQGHINEWGEPDALYRNMGGTNFGAVPFTDGAFLDEDGVALREPPRDWGLAAMFRDINGDGLPDLYVCNDFASPDRCWINQGGGRFRAIARLAMRKSSYSSMGVDFADINRDGFDDFLVLDMLSRSHVQRLTQIGAPNPETPVIGRMENRPQYGMNTLFLNRGDGTFAELSQLSGLEATEWSWTPIFLDVDLDGWEDVLISTGQERAAIDPDVVERLKRMRAQRRMSDAEIFQARKIFPRLAPPNLAFRNRGDLTFEEVGGAWGFDTPGVSQGMALADLDNDGDLDVIINNLNGPAGIYRNETSAPRVAVRLKGLAPNTRGIGAKIKVLGGPVAMQSQEMICGGRYLSGDDAVRVFAAGHLTNRIAIEVIWRSGRRSVVPQAKPNALYEIDEAAALDAQTPDQRVQSSEFRVQSLETAPGSALRTAHSAGPQPSTLNPQPFFQDVSQLIGHTHHDEPFDDYIRQPLLPRRLSQLGPGISWFDLDGDGWDDLIIASGKGGQLGVYQNDGHGGFKQFARPPVTLAVTRDQTTVLGWLKAPGRNVVLAGSANYEDGLAVGSSVRQFNFGEGVIDDPFPARESSSGPLAMADVDSDGNLDLFVGGRVVPGKYPQAASSILFRNVNGKFETDADNTARLAQIGLVSGAIFSDLDGDGSPDLILACEWGPIRVLHNENGRLSDATDRLGLAPFKGWWNGVAVGDFDGDGRLDIVASNWGRNTPYESHRARPLQILFGDLDRDGTEDLVETYYDRQLNKRVPERGWDLMSRAIPFLAANFSTHRAYAQASIEEIFGERLRSARTWEANWLESTLFLNRGGHFEAKPLPVEAQLAPAFGISVGDLDGDGFEDIFLSQNFFAVRPETPRYDGGRGLALRGDGHAGFKALSGQESGVMIYGEQRGCALADYDGDGRIDLAVTQNGAQTKLYRNVGAKPGLRVRLLGPSGNPQGVGAMIRLVFGSRFGAAREVHAGSGYWSQDSAIQVMATPEAPSKIWVRWPGGKTSTNDIPAGAQEITIGVDAKLTMIR